MEGPSAALSATDFQLAYTLKVPGMACFTRDQLGNTYTANIKGDIVKWDRNGRQTATANHKSMGIIQSIDAGNPFEIFVFYKEQNKLLFFDNQLNDRGLVDFELSGYFLLSAVARSYDNMMWLFDLNDLKLKKVKRDMEVVCTSGNVREFATTSSFDPHYMVDVNRDVYLFNRTSGLYRFDIFGNFIQKISLPSDVSALCVSGDVVYYVSHQKVYVMDTRLLIEKQLLLDPLPPAINGIAVSSGEMVLGTENDSLYVYHTSKNR
jgi:hypothetical protein